MAYFRVRDVTFLLPCKTSEQFVEVSQNHSYCSECISLYSVVCICYSYSMGPGIYGSKQSESEGVAQGQGMFTAIYPW